MFWIWKDRVAELELKIAAAEQEVQQMTHQAQLFFNHGKHYAGKIDEYFRPQFLLNSQNTAIFLSEQPIPCVRGWDESCWKSWQPEEALLENSIRIGEYVESRGEGSNQFKAIPKNKATD